MPMATEHPPDRWRGHHASSSGSSDASSWSSRNKASNNTATRKRKVHFVISKFTYIEPEERRYMPPLDLCELYYTKEEYALVRLETTLTLKLLLAQDPRLYPQGNNCNDDDLFCTRGVEELSPEKVRRRLSSQARLTRAVLQEQRRQRKRGIFDPEAIADLSRYLSALNEVQARNQGIQDAIVARQILKDENKDVVGQEDDDDEDDVGEAMELSSAILFQKAKLRNSQKGESVGSNHHNRCDSSSTVSTLIVDDWSERSLYADDDDDDAHSCTWGRSSQNGPEARITILEPRPALLQQAFRLFQRKPACCPR